MMEIATLLLPDRTSGTEAENALRLGIFDWRDVEGGNEECRRRTGRRECLARGLAKPPRPTSG